jgi:thiamine biosynthesis lipoprotein
MGTITEIAVVHRDAGYAQRAIDAGFAELRRVESAMTRFADTSDVGRANLHAAAVPVAISPATAAVLSRALLLAADSDGRFDPALGRAMALWDFGSRRQPPPADALRRYAGQRLYEQVELGRRGGADVVLFHAPEVALDLGGIAKGYGVDRAVEALRAWGIAHALVNAGGDLYAVGRSPDGDPWEIGIQSPSDPDGLAATLRVEDEAIATSGDYQQFFEHGGRRYHHLLDPATAEPHRVTSRSLTIVAADCLTADAAATTLFGASPPLARAILNSMPGARIVHST